MNDNNVSYTDVLNEQKLEGSKKKRAGYTPFLNFFAVYIITIAFIYIFAITFLDVPKENVRFADTAIGFILGTVIALIINWAFRSSKAQIDKESRNGGE